MTLRTDSQATCKRPAVLHKLFPRVFGFLPLAAPPNTPCPAPNKRPGGGAQPHRGGPYRSAVGRDRRGMSGESPGRSRISHFPSSVSDFSHFWGFGQLSNKYKGWLLFVANPLRKWDIHSPLKMRFGPPGQNSRLFFTG